VCLRGAPWTELPRATSFSALGAAQVAHHGGASSPAFPYASPRWVKRPKTGRRQPSPRGAHAIRIATQEIQFIRSFRDRSLARVHDDDIMKFMAKAKRLRGKSTRFPAPSAPFWSPLGDISGYRRLSCLSLAGSRFAAPRPSTSCRNRSRREGRPSRAAQRSRLR